MSTTAKLTSHRNASCSDTETYPRDLQTLSKYCHGTWSHYSFYFMEFKHIKYISVEFLKSYRKILTSSPDCPRKESEKGGVGVGVCTYVDNTYSILLASSFRLILTLCIDYFFSFKRSFWGFSFFFFFFV